MSYQRPATVACAYCRRVVSVGPIGRVRRYCSPTCRTAACEARRGGRPSSEDRQRALIWGILQDAGIIPADKAQIGGFDMTYKALTTLLALIALSMPAMEGTIYATDGNVVGRCTTDSPDTSTLLAAVVSSLATPPATPSLCMTPCPRC